MISNGPVHFRMHVYSPSTSKIIQEQARLPVLGQNLLDLKISKLLPHLLEHFNEPYSLPRPYLAPNVTVTLIQTRPDYKPNKTQAILG